MHEGIIEKLYQEYTVHGFISEDHIFDVLEENGISSEYAKSLVAQAGHESA